MPAKKEFSTAEEAAKYIEFLRRRNRERATDPENMKYLKINVKNIVIIFIIKIKI